MITIQSHERRLLLDQTIAQPYQWRGSPQDFLGLVLTTTFAANRFDMPLTLADRCKGMVSATADNIAAAFLEYMTVDMYPFKNFQDLQKRARPSGDMIRKGLEVIHIVMEDAAIHKLLSNTGVTFHHYTFVESPAELWAEAFIIKASEKIKFNDAYYSMRVLALKLA
ncbi:hypothetical protein HNQ91_006079 [Filimonas zeae]|uniref:Uncharacterized protein n=1 Tax=Filimonas zeae TaxID=1737353 RepID=A0A917N1A8_9BACT|nr:hypothetical protein [Filimonas zeae]MDR6342992.1 hypothetical protein [Filimonas zeae]GGH83519.1 hypothetical protein GCM10011379_59030 [Filimonas zeae]